MSFKNHISCYPKHPDELLLSDRVCNENTQFKSAAKTKCVLIFVFRFLLCVLQVTQPVC